MDVVLSDVSSSLRQFMGMVLWQLPIHMNEEPRYITWGVLPSLVPKDINTRLVGQNTIFEILLIFRVLGVVPQGGLSLVSSSSFTR